MIDVLGFPVMTNETWLSESWRCNWENQVQTCYIVKIRCKTEKIMLKKTIEKKTAKGCWRATAEKLLATNHEHFAKS